MDLISYADLNSTSGVYLDSSTYINPPAGWTANTAAINSAPTCVANWTANEQKVAEATQWNFSHLTWNKDADLAPPLAKLIFLRVGDQWVNEIELDFGGITYTDIQLSFRNNAATQGDKHENIPVISFTESTWTGTQILSVTLKRPGTVTMGLRLIDNASNWYFFEMEWACEA